MSGASDILRVVVASRINHSIELARALRTLRVQLDYLGPVVFDPTDRMSSFGSLSKRRTPVNDLPLHRLWLSEAVTQTAYRMPISRDNAHRLASTALDAEISARMPTCDVFHWHSNCISHAAARAKGQGAFLICDHRALHPDEEHPGGGPLHGRLIRELELADLIVLNSSAAERSFVRHGVSPERLRVVPLGVDLSGWARGEQPAVSSREPVLLFVGAVAERKGLRLLAEALRHVPPSIEVRIVGPIADIGLANELRRAYRGVRILGPMSPAQLRDQYREARALVLPSQAEAFGLVVLEALASGTPVIVSDGCGSSEVVAADTRRGDVFPSGNAHALAHAIAARTLSPGLDAAPSSMNDFTWANYRRRVRDLYLSEVLPRVAGEPL